MGYHIALDLTGYFSPPRPDDIITRVRDPRFGAKLIHRLHELGFRRTKKLKPSKILFEHVEVDEELPPGTQEMVEEILAENLFQMWLAEVGHRKEEHEGSSVHSEIN